MTGCRHPCENRDGRHTGNSNRDSSSDRSVETGRHGTQPYHGYRLRSPERRRGTGPCDGPENHVACKTDGQATSRPAAQTERGSRVSIRRRHQRCPGIVPRPGGIEHGYGNLGSKGGERHHPARRLLPQHRDCRDVGTFAVQEHPTLHRLPAHHHPHCYVHRACRKLHGRRHSAHGDADVVGEPHHGHLQLWHWHPSRPVRT